MRATRTAGPRRNGDLLIDSLIGVQSIGVEGTLRSGALHRATGLREMTAVVEAATVEEGTELREAGTQRFRVESPRPHLPQPRRVHHVSAPAPRRTDHSRQGHEDGRPSRMLPFAPLLVD